jgi:hypothetical protein
MDGLLSAGPVTAKSRVAFKLGTKVFASVTVAKRVNGYASISGVAFLGDAK